MSDWITDYLKYTEKWESPTIYHEAVALSMIAAVVERKVWIPQGNNGIYPNLYIILVGPPATRKSTAALLGTDLIEQVEGLSSLASDVITKEAMYCEMEESIRTFTYDDSTYEHTSYTVVATEWGMFLPEKDMSFILALIKLYDCEKRFKKGTKTQGNNLLPNVYFNMLGCIQPKKLGEILPKSAIGTGFTSRIIFVVADKPRHDEPSPTLDGRLEGGLITDLHKFHNLVGEFRWTEKANAWYDNWYRHERNNTFLFHDERFMHYVHRKPQHLMKVAMLMRISRDHSELVIDTEDLLRGLAWLNALEGTMPEAYGSYGLSKSAEITELVRKFVRDKTTTTTMEILSIYFRDITAKELREVIETLVGGGHIKATTIAGEDVTLRWIGK